jgi:hypothetical protein
MGRIDGAMRQRRMPTGTGTNAAYGSLLVLFPADRDVIAEVFGVESFLAVRARDRQRLAAGAFVRAAPPVLYLLDSFHLQAGMK